jgi:hypothetical protein
MHDEQQFEPQTILSPVAPATRRRPWLRLARLLWLVVTVLLISLYIASTPTFLEQIQKPCPVDESCIWPQHGPARTQLLEDVGISITFFAIYHWVLLTVLALVSWILAAIIFWRRGHEIIGVLTASVLVITGSNFGGPIQFFAMSTPILVWLANLLNAVSFASFFLFLLLFPDGHFTPAWTRRVALAIAIWSLTFLIRPESGTALRFLQKGVFLSLIVFCLWLQIYRYRHIHHPVQRQQTKWVVFGTSLALTLWLSLLLPYLFVPTLEHSFYGIFLDAHFSLVPLLIPLSISMAILRSRLWDIDLLIRRTLLYTLLTITLLLLYAGSILVLQSLVSALSGQRSAIVTVISTLAIAFLFAPLRRFFQNNIDRRFYRRKYNAQQTLEAFGATARNEIALEELTDHLLTTVEETMQPTHVSLWLRPVETVHRQGGGAK